MLCFSNSFSLNAQCRTLYRSSQHDVPMSSRPGGGWVIVHTTCRISALPRGRPHPNNPRVRVRRRRQKVIDDGRTCVRPPQLTPCLPNKPKLTPHTPNPPIIAPCLNPHFFPHADQVLCFSWSPFLCVVTRDGTMVRVLGLWRGSVVGQEKGHKLERAFVFGTPANPCCNGRRRRGRQTITPCFNERLLLAHKSFPLNSRGQVTVTRSAARFPLGVAAQTESHMRLRARKVGRAFWCKCHLRCTFVAFFGVK